MARTVSITSGNYARPARSANRSSKYDDILNQFEEFEPGQGVHVDFTGDDAEALAKTYLAGLRGRMYRLRNRANAPDFPDAVCYSVQTAKGYSVVFGLRAADE